MSADVNSKSLVANARKALVLGLALVLVSSNAVAASWTSVLQGNVTPLMEALVTILVALGVVGGLGAFLYGGKLWWDKANNRTGDDVKAMSIVYSMVGGAFLMALAFVGSTTVETLGGSASDIGKKPTISR